MVSEIRGKTLEEVERLHVMQTIRMFNGDKMRAATALGIGCRVLYRKLREWQDLDDARGLLDELAERG